MRWAFAMIICAVALALIPQLLQAQPVAREPARGFTSADGTGTDTEWSGNASGDADTNGNLFTTDGRVHAYTNVNAATYTVLTTDYLMGVSYTATGVVTVTIPTALLAAGRVFHVKDSGGNANANNITVATGGAETIDGSATYTVNGDYHSVSLISDGTNWFVY